APAAATEPATQPAVATTEAATQPTTQAATAPATMPTTLPGNGAGMGGITTRPGAKLSVNFKDARLDYVLDQLSQVAGYVIVPETTIEGRVTVMSKQPVTPEEAVVLLNTVLKTNGYTIIQQDRILKVVSREKGKKSAPVYFGADASKISNSDEMITQVIPVGSVDAGKLRADLTPLLSPEADVTSNAGSNSIIVTDSASSIKRLVEIIAVLDQHRTAVTDIRIFQLKYASAASAARLITDIFKPAGGAGAQGNQGMFFGGGGFGRGGGFNLGGAPGGGGGTDNNAIAGQVLTSSDERTNTLVVSGPTDTLKVVERVVKELDANPAEGQTFFIYPLKNSNASNLQGVLNNFFGASSGSTGGTSNRTTSGSGSSSGFGSSGFGGSSSSSSRGGSSRSSSGGGLGSSGLGSSNLGGSTNTQNRSTGFSGGSAGGFGGGSINSALAKANSDLAGKAFVVAEPDTNALLVSVDAKAIERVRALIEELDRPVPQVMIKVLIAEVTHSDGSDIGGNFSVLNKRASGNGSSGGSDFGIGSAITSAAASGGPNGMVFQMLEENATAAIRALANTNKLDVLSRPYILASDNQTASIMVGQEVPIVTSTTITTNGQYNNVQYQDIGIILNVTPHVNPDGLVILDVNPQISALTGETVTVQAGVNAPVFDNRQAQSRVAIMDGHTIVIGGLMEDKKTKNVDKIPLLGDIPGIGFLFSHTTEKKTKTELLIFLTPHVALQPPSLKGMSQQEKESTKLVPQAVGPGIFQEHLKGMEIGGAQTRPSTTLPAEKPKNDQNP
ncbi:MAG: type II secretion system secretin GspD, partial [Phycisphaerae bacterium]